MKIIPVLVAVLGLVGVLQPTQWAWAHAKLVRSDPAARATLRRAPEYLRLWFSERIEAAYSSVELRDASDRILSQSAFEVSADDPKRIALKLPPLKDGQYTVRYRVLSVDGHVVQASYRFQVRTSKL